MTDQSAVGRRCAVVAFLFALSILPGNPMSAQSDTVEAGPSMRQERFGVGVYGAWALNMLDGSFAPFDEPKCGVFETGVGHGIVVGGRFELPVATEIRLNLEAEYHDRSGTMTFPCVDPAHIRLPSGATTDATTENIADISNHALSLRALVASRLFGLSLEAAVGPYLSYAVSAGYDAREEIRAPVAAEFVDGGQSRPIGSGDLSASGLSLGIAGAFRYLLPMGGDFDLVPEISYELPLDDELSPGAIRTSSLRFGIGVVMRSYQSPPPPAIAAAPPPELKAHLVVGANTLDGRSIGAMSDTLDFHLQRTVSTRLNPLLSYVFFDNASAEIPDRYHRRTPAQASAFDESHMDDESVLGTYYNLLDIIGSRMRRDTLARITVTGTQPDVPPGARTLSLAADRAAAVKQYLVDTWSIDGSRISTAVRRMPETPSNDESQAGRDENRRAEITSDSYDIIAPVLLADTTYSTVIPELSVFPVVHSQAGVANWTLDVGLADSLIDRFGDTSGSPPMINWQPPATLALWRRDSLLIDARLDVRDSAGQTVEAEYSVPLRHVLDADNVVYGTGHYSLILFDFGSDKLRPEHQKIIDLINDRSIGRHQVVVEGFTDRIGEPEFNRTLSQRRAATVAEHLDATVTAVHGRGEDGDLYDESMPEGRFYSRCVTVTVR